MPSEIAWWDGFWKGLALAISVSAVVANGLIYAITRAAWTLIMLAAGAATCSLVHAQEPGVLQGFSGSFSGGGTLKRAADGNPRALNCTFQGSSSGRRLALNGRCSAGILSTTSNIIVSVDPRSQRVIGSYRDGAGTIADLSGSRRGNTLALAFTETAGSFNPGPPGRLTIGQNSTHLNISLRSTRSDAGQNIELSLRKQ
jgi:hypothetical protein